MSERIKQSELARRLGISRAAVSKAAKAGRIVVGEDGLVDAAEAVRAFVGNEAAEIAEGAPEAPGNEMYQRRLRWYDARILEVEARTVNLRREHATKLGELIPHDAILPLVGQAFSNVRARFLAIPSATAAELAVERTPAGCSRIVTTAIHEALEGLSAEALKEAALRKARAAR